MLLTPAWGTLLDEESLDWIVLAVITFIGGLLYGASGYFLLGLVVWLGARGVGIETQARKASQVVAFAALPFALSILVTLPAIVLGFGTDWFRTGGADDGGGPRHRRLDRARVRTLVARAARPRPADDLRAALARRRRRARARSRPRCHARSGFGCDLARLDRPGPPAAAECTSSSGGQVGEIPCESDWDPSRGGACRPGKSAMVRVIPSGGRSRLNLRKAYPMAAYLRGPIVRWLGALSLALLGGVVVVAVLPGASVPLQPGAAPWWLVAVAFMLAEAFVHLTRGRVSVVALSPHAAVLGAALFLLDPAGLFAAQFAGVVMVLVVVDIGRRDALIRLGTTTGIAAGALVIFVAIGLATDLSGPLGWLAAVLAVTAATAAFQPIWLRSRDGRPSGIVPHINWLAALGATASAGISIVALELIRNGRPSQIPLLVLPFVSCAAAVWATTSEHRRLVNLRLLADAIRRAHEAPDRDASVVELLEAPRTLVGADTAWLVLLPRNGAESAQVASTGPDGISPLRSSTLRRDRAAGIRAEVDRGGSREVLGADTADGLHGLMSDLCPSACDLRASPRRGWRQLVPPRRGCESSPAGYRSEDIRRSRRSRATRP